MFFCNASYYTPLRKPNILKLCCHTLCSQSESSSGVKSVMCRVNSSDNELRSIRISTNKLSSSSSFQRHRIRS